MTAMTNQVSGEIRFPPETMPSTNASVTIIIEDVSVADSKAPIITQQVIDNVDYHAGKTIEFAFNGIEVDETARYNVRVHVRNTSETSIRVDDYITMRNYPVLTHDAPDHVIIDLQCVGG